MDAMFHRQALILNFEVEILFPEDVGESACSGAGRVVVALCQTFGDLAFEASGEADQAAGVFGEKFLADARLVVKAVQRGFRGDLHQVAVAFFVLSKYQQVVVGIALRRRAMVVFLADVELATDDRLHAGVFGRIDEVDCAKNVAMVGHGHGGHAHLFHALAKFLDVTGAVEHGVVRMQVQVDELGHVR